MLCWIGWLLLVTGSKATSVHCLMVSTYGIPSKYIINTVLSAGKNVRAPPPMLVVILLIVWVGSY